MVPPRFHSIQLCYIVLTVEWTVWSYGVWYCCAPSLPLDTAVFSRVNGGVDSSCCAPFLPLDAAVLIRAEGGVEFMVLRGLVLWCRLPPS